MNHKIILTIGRQFGSGGREIGKKLADIFQIGYYDKELIFLAAKESGLCPEVFEKADEKASSAIGHAFSVGFSPMAFYLPYNDILSNERLFQLQSDTIRNLAENESCVLVGRCADYILRDNPNCFSIFIHSKVEQRIQNIVKRQTVTEQEAKELIAKTDKSRSAYYNYYTNKEWGHASSYNISIDSSVLGTDETVLFIKDFVERNCSNK
jgi:cytidylate kinase